MARPSQADDYRKTPLAIGVEQPEAPPISWYRDGNCHGHLAYQLLDALALARCSG